MRKNPTYMALLRPTRLLISEKSGTYTIKWSYTIIWQVKVLSLFVLSLFYIFLSQLNKDQFIIGLIGEDNIFFQDPFTRNLRRTVMRYVNLSIVLVFRLVSAKVHARFPDYQSLIKAKLMLPSGCRTFQSWTFNPILSPWTFQPIIAKTSHTVILPD